MKSKKLKTKVMALAICMVILAAMSGIVLADQSEEAVDLDNNGILGDETGTVSAPSVSSEELGVRGTTETVTFPSSSDTYDLKYYPYWWNTGDNVYGSRTLSLSSVNKVDMNLRITYNVLSSGGHCDMALLINGENVGTWQVVEGDSVIAKTFTFDAITGPTYSIKIVETNTVESGKGSCSLSPDVSTLTFYGATEETTISVYTDKTSYTAGDTMRLGLDVANSGDAQPVKLEIWLELPSGGIYPLIGTSVTLPAGLDYSNSNFKVFTVPSISAGTYAWQAGLSDPVTGALISEDAAEWVFGSMGASIEIETADITEVLEQATVVIDFGEPI